MTCPAAKDVWIEYVKRIQKSPSEEDGFINIFEMLRGQLSEDVLQRVVFVARQVWFRRNKYVVGEELISPTKVNRIADEQVQLFNSSEQRPTSRGSNVMEPEASRWEKPLPGWVKINWDASIDKQGKRMGVGVLVRDHEGKVRGA